MARRYEFHVLVARTISHSFAALTREILFLPLEHKIHIFSPPCNILYVFLNFIDFNRNVLIIVIILFLIYFMTCKVALHVAKKSVTCYVLFAIRTHWRDLCHFTSNLTDLVVCACVRNLNQTAMIWQVANAFNDFP